MIYVYIYIQDNYIIINNPRPSYDRHDETDRNSGCCNPIGRMVEVGRKVHLDSSLDTQHQNPVPRVFLSKCFESWMLIPPVTWCCPKMGYES